MDKSLLVSEIHKLACSLLVVKGVKATLVWKLIVKNRCSITLTYLSKDHQRIGCIEYKRS
jgi:hypothetical protein